MFNISDTICAICTPKGTGAISAIRISGSESWNIAQKIFSNTQYSIPNTQYPIPNTQYSFKHMHAQHGYIKDNDKTIDEVIILPYKAPNSFTAEDTIEIFCHGGLQVTSQILDLCLKHGARQAKNGEFTFRAFVNGRIDLTEAEAINEIISAENEKAVIVASQTLSGSLKSKVAGFRERLLHLITSIESSVEFPMDVADTSKEEIIANLKNTRSEISELIKDSKEGLLLREGIRVSIVGPANAGKSSLLNQLLESERAIVSDEPGTTRDTVEEKILINGWSVVLVDTAGIREKDSISNSEKMGIERSKQSIKNSDIVLGVFDVTNNCHDQSEFSTLLKDKPTVMIGNKIDLIDMKDLNKNGFDILISAKNGNNIEQLKKLLIEKTSSLLNTQHSILNTQYCYINQRQKELLIQCNAAIEASIDLANKNISEDLISDELKNAISKLDEISGRTVSDEVIKNIFAKFCIGK